MQRHYRNMLRLRFGGGTSGQVFVAESSADALAGSTIVV
jgi:hypothetical protein